jgi:hypothetical protein
MRFGLPAALALVAVLASQAAANPHATLSPLTSPTIKILVNKDGWYRVPMSTLTGAGFVPPANLNLIHLTMNNTEVPFELRNGNLEFYGQKLDTLYTDTRTYWLSVGGTDGTPMPYARARAAAGTPTGSFQTTQLLRGRVSYYASFLTHAFPGTQVGNNIFGDAFFPGGPASEPIPAQNVDASQTASLRVDLYGAAQQNRTVTVTLNGNTLGTMPGSGVGPMTAIFPVGAGIVTSGTNTVGLADAGAADFALVDALTLTYPHTYNLDSTNNLTFSVTGGTPVSVGGFPTSSARLIDISNPASPKELLPTVTQTGGTFTISVTPPLGSTKLYAFADSAPLSPLSVVADTPSTLMSPSNTADLIVIAFKDATRDFISAAAPLVTLRQSQGLAVKVVDIQDVYDEFGSPLGAKDPAAITAFLNYAQTNWAGVVNTHPKYVLLVGDATQDPRGYFSPATNDIIPTTFWDATFSEAPSDDALTDFNNDGKPEMAVGRLPVRTNAEAQALISKIVGYSGTAARPRTATLVSDNFDRADYHFDQFSTDLKTTSLDPNGVTTTSINRPSGTGGDAATHTSIINSANSGPIVMNWFGHGSFLTWNGNLLVKADAATLTNTNALSLYMMMTCQTGYFADATQTFLGEALLMASGGAVAVWASTGDTVPFDQVNAAKTATSELFGNPQKRLGDAMLDAKQSINDVDVEHTWALLGDPSMKLNITAFP